MHFWNFLVRWWQITATCGVWVLYEGCGRESWLSIKFGPLEIDRPTTREVVTLLIVLGFRAFVFTVWVLVVIRL